LRDGFMSRYMAGVVPLQGVGHTHLWVVGFETFHMAGFCRFKGNTGQ
jgi:hypothetical protein